LEGGKLLSSQRRDGSPKIKKDPTAARDKAEGNGKAFSVPFTEAGLKCTY